jgi:hypothetical protein
MNALSTKIRMLIENNQRAMASAAAKGDDAVVQLCCGLHWRLRRIEDYLDERASR